MFFWCQSEEEQYKWIQELIGITRGDGNNAKALSWLSASMTTLRDGDIGRRIWGEKEDPLLLFEPSLSH